MTWWIKPGLNVEATQNLHRNLFRNMSQGGNCTNCGGSGRVIYTNPEGSMGDMACMACQGSGQSSL